MTAALVAAPDAIVATQGLSKSFRGQRVVDGLDFKLGRRDRVALVGLNGAGKTTLIRCLLGEYRFQGQVRVTGLDPRRARCQVLRRVAFVPQLPPPLRMPVKDLIAYAAALVGVDPARMLDVAARLGLEPEAVAGKPFARLSGGQKQKVLISIALGRAVDLLILDEPSANLDPAARQTLLDLLGERQDTAMIISSHRFEEVATLVNRVVEMDCGRIILDDAVEDMVDPTARQRCALTLTRPDPAFAQAIGLWGFRSEDGTRWQGELAGGDRLKFLGTVSRYSGIIATLHLQDAGPQREEGQ